MYSAAGCLFVSDQHVLAGYQPHKRTAVITGFGGKREGGEEPLQTAWRETLEELLGIGHVPKDLIEFGINQQPIKSMSSNGYTQIVYSFDTLEAVLKRVSINSPLYDQTPQTIGDLLFHRKQGIHTEVPTLCLLPLEGQVIANHFVKDILSASNRNQCHDCSSPSRSPRNKTWSEGFIDERCSSKDKPSGHSWSEGPLFVEE